MSQFVVKSSARLRSRRLITCFMVAAMATCMGSSYAQSNGTYAAVPTSFPSILKNATLKSHALASQKLHVTVCMKFPNQAAVQAFVDSVSDPASPNYRNFVTPAEFGARFGQSPANVKQMVDFLKGQGFTIKLVADNNLTIMTNCTVAQAEAAFHTTINNYHANVVSVGGRTDFFSFSTPVQFPSALSPLVMHVNGLENYEKPVPRISKLGTRKAAATAKTAAAKGKKFGSGTTLTPPLTRTLYNTAPLYNAGIRGQGRTVAISNYDGYRLSNVPLFYAKYALPAPAGGVGSNITVNVVNSPIGTGFPSGEGDLDVQMPLGMSPLCNFIIYEDGDFSLVDVLTTIANQNKADVVSESYGWNLGDSLAEAAHAAHVQISAQGITYMQSSGDSGTSLEPFAYSNYEPETLMVGGTVANVNSTGVRTDEVGWDGGGGGWAPRPYTWSVLPSWQKGKGVPTTINSRLSPDISLQAAASGGAFFFFQGGSLTVADGTSFSSPIFTGCLSVAEQKLVSLGLPGDSAGKHRLGRVANLIYSQNGRADVYHDILVGNNGVLPNGAQSNAGPFWDTNTGWGPIDFTGFVNTFHFIPPLTLTPSAVSIYGGQGTSPTGAVAQLGNADGSYYSVGSVNNVSGQVAAAQVTFTVPRTPDPISTLTLSWTDNSTLPSSEFTYLLNRNTNQFDLMVTYPLKATNTTFTLSVPNLTTYMNTAGQVTILHRAIVPPRLAKPFRLNLDQASLQVIY